MRPFPSCCPTGGNKSFLIRVNLPASSVLGVCPEAVSAALRLADSAVAKSLRALRASVRTFLASLIRAIRAIRG